MNRIKKIIIVAFCIYSPYLMGVFKAVQDSTLEALQLYENGEDQLDQQNDDTVGQEAQEYLDDANFDDQKPVFEKDPEQYFVDKKEVQERINAHEILEYSLDEILNRAREYPGYYGDSDEDELTAWYEQAQQNSGYQKQILDHIKDDAKKYSLEKILHHAEHKPLYKGLLSYQKIVDTYYEINPEKIAGAQKDFLKAIQYVHLDDCDNDELFEQDVKKFLMEYRKLPSSLQQSMNIETVHGVPYVGGVRIKNAKSFADFIVAHKEEYQNCKDIIVLLEV